MLLDGGKQWLCGLFQYNSVEFLTALPDTLDCVVFGTSGAVVQESDDWVKGQVVYDSGEPGHAAHWVGGAPTITLLRGSAHADDFEDSDLILNASFTDYALTESLSIKEVLLCASRATYMGGGNPAYGYSPSSVGVNATTKPWFPVARFLITEFVINLGDDLDLSWILSFKGELSDG